MRNLVVFSCFLICFSLSAAAKKYDAEVTLHSGEKVSVIFRGFKDELISPSVKFKTENSVYGLKDVSEILVLQNNISYEVFSVTLFEDDLLIAAKRVSGNLSETLVKYRPCACKDSFRYSRAYISEVKGSKYVLIKHVFRDKILKWEGEYHGVNSKLKNLLEPYSFRFSAIPEVL